VNREDKKHPRRAYDVLSTVLSRGDAIELSRRMSCSPQLITAWRRQPKARDVAQTGKLSPLDRIRTLILMVKDDDGEPDRAYPIGDYVAGLLGGVFVPVIHPGRSNTSDLLARISLVLVETGEAIESARRTGFEGENAPEQKARCSKEISDAIVALLQLKQIIDPKSI